MIIKLEKLRETPCNKWLKLFKEGELNVHEAFKEHGTQYEWLYKYSDYDLISWQIKNECFNWEEHSYLLPKHSPSKFDSDKFNWEKHSSHLAEYQPNLLDTERFNWEWASWAVAIYCSHLLDPDKYNWEEFSNTVVQYCPEYFEYDKYNWNKNSWFLENYCIKNFENENFDMKRFYPAVVRCCPHLLKQNIVYL